MNTLIKIKIALQDLPHKCERTLLIPENVTMLQIHFLIQESFGWENAHLFEFVDKKWKSTIRAGVPDDLDMDFGFAKITDASKANLKHIFVEQNNAKAFWYWYDFGDDWWHRISFLKLTKKDLNSYEGIPVCIKAQGKCPPEDVGGPWGYVNFLDIVRDKEHPEHNEIKEWYGYDDEAFDVNEVDLKRINLSLQSYFKSKHWNTRGL